MVKGDQEDPISDGPTLNLRTQADSLSGQKKKKKKMINGFIQY